MGCLNCVQNVKAIYFVCFFVFGGNDIVVLFSGFQKKIQQTPEREIKKALTIKKEYYEAKGNQ